MNSVLQTGLERFATDLTDSSDVANSGSATGAAVPLRVVSGLEGTSASRTSFNHGF